MPQVTSSTRPFGALLSAMVTPFTADGEVDLEAAVQLARRLVDSGHDGLVLNGTTGEAPTTHAPEKAELIAAVVEAVGDRAYVVAGAGSNDTLHAVRMAEQAVQAGAHGLLVVSPYYSRPSQPGVIAHVRAVLDAADLPTMLYDVPGRAGVRLADAPIDTLAADERVVAFKDATGDTVNAARAIARTGLAWYSGDDALLAQFLAVGGAGIVGVVTQAASGLFREVLQAWDRGDVTAMRRAYAATLPVTDAVNGAGFQAVHVKAALEVLGFIPRRTVRLPYVPASDEEVEAIRAVLRAAGLLDSALA